MKRLSIGTAVFLALAAPAAFGDGGKIHTELTGSQEVPVVSTVGNGQFSARISGDGQAIDWVLTYDGMQGIVTQAHIHVAQRAVNGGIVLWLCGTTNTPGPAGTAVCTSPSGQFTGTFGPGNVQTVATQQIGPNELGEVVAAIRAGFTYANVHTLISPGGEIRGQIRHGDGGH